MSSGLRSNVAEVLLGKLFDRWQRAANGNDRAITLSISGRDGGPYFATTGEERRQLHATLENAEKAGAVKLELGKFAASHELKRIVLNDGKKLATFLGLTTATDAIARLEMRLRPILDQCEYDWIHDTFHNACIRWQRGKPAWRLSLPQHTSEIYLLFRALIAVADGKHEGLDMRTFSARYLDDSKAFERLKFSFSGVWAQHLGLDHEEPDDLLATIGLEKTPLPTLLRGPFIIEYGKNRTELATIRPYFGIPRELLDEAKLIHPPSYVLAIENATSFFRHCRETSDDGLIIFSGGFPNPNVQRFLSRLDSELPETIPFFHWGDTDIRGLEILDLIERLCPNRTISAHLMSRDPWVASHMPTPQELHVIKKLRSHQGAAAYLSQQIESKGIPKDFEQENIDPAPPPYS